MTASLPSTPTRRWRCGGFTLTELAMVLFIVGLLMMSLMFTLSGQTDSRNLSTAQRQLEEARELLLAFALVHGRLPCPATASSNGMESIATAAGTGTGGNCTASAYYAGYLPAATLGFNPTDSSGFALDVWGNRIRYAVSRTSEPHFTSNAAISANWGTVTPADIDICKHLTAPNQSSCGSTANRVVSNGTAVAVIWSQGKNFLSSGAVSIDEASNNDAFAAFVSRPPSPSDATEGEFDDLVVWLPVGMLYGRLVAGGKLP
jgi:prepilin-type N-terminal cleavage/methylation domain-containing protein